MDHLNVPDFSCEIDKPIKYLRFINEHFSQLKNRNEHGSLVLDEVQADTFDWMIADALSVLYEINTALYSDPETTA